MNVAPPKLPAVQVLTVWLALGCVSTQVASPLPAVPASSDSFTDAIGVCAVAPAAKDVLYL